MNILFLTKEYKHANLPNSGGTGTFITNLAKLLVKNGHNVNVFCLGTLDSVFIDQGVNIHFKKNTLPKNHIYKLLKSISKKTVLLEKFYYYLLKLELKKISKELYKYIKKNNLLIDIIETHDFDGISLYLNDKIPYVIRCHGSFSIFSNYFGFDVPKYKLDWEKEAIQKAKNIITISKYCQKINHELFNLKDSKLIYNGIDSGKFIFDKNIIQIPKSIFFLGNISKEKGADLAFDIFLKILKRHSTTSLHYIGIETDFKKKLFETIVNNNISEKVIFHGYQSSENIIQLLSAASVIIFPSKGETFGISLCESLLLNKIVIASNIPSFNEIIENNVNGFLANSLEEYVYLINTIFNNFQNYVELQTNSRDSIIKNFNQEKMLQETLKYYQEIIEN